MSFHKILNRLAQSHPSWDRRMCVLAARLYLGIDQVADYERGQLVSMVGQPLLNRRELREVASSWMPVSQKTLKPAWDLPV